MDSPFRLAVAAAAALGLLWIFTTYLLPGLFPGTPLKDALLNGLEAAEREPGKIVSRLVGFRNGEALPADSLDGPARSVNFRCTDALQCCQRQKISAGCKVALDDRKLIAEQAVALPVHFRCNYEENIFLCSAYFGREPAQLELKDFRVAGEIELGRDNPVAAFKVLNSGKVKAQDVIATAKVYKLTTVEGKEVEALHAGPFNRDFEEIPPSGWESLSIPLEVREPGNYKVWLEVHGIESGKAVREAGLKATGARPENKCRATAEGRTQWEGTECLREYQCEGCAYDYECKLAWEPRLGDKRITDWSSSGVWATEEPEKCA